MLIRLPFVVLHMTQTRYEAKPILVRLFCLLPAIAYPLESEFQYI